LKAITVNPEELRRCEHRIEHRIRSNPQP